jgi:hypothetical protein
MAPPAASPAAPPAAPPVRALDTASLLSPVWFRLQAAGAQNSAQHADDAEPEAGAPGSAQLSGDDAPEAGAPSSAQGRDSARRARNPAQGRRARARAAAAETDDGADETRATPPTSCKRKRNRAAAATTTVYWPEAMARKCAIECTARSHHARIGAQGPAVLVSKLGGDGRTDRTEQQQQGRGDRSMRAPCHAATPAACLIHHRQLARY